MHFLYQEKFRKNFELFYLIIKTQKVNLKFSSCLLEPQKK